MRYWRKANARAGNVHLGGDAARLASIPFTGQQAFLRPSASDVDRAQEFQHSIYFSETYLHQAIKHLQPKVLLDIGANIGLSSLSLLKEFPSIKKVIGIEAEAKNFEVLEMNYRLWRKSYPGVDFIPIHGVATASSQASIVELGSLNELTGKNSASGTFRFQPVEDQTDLQAKKDHAAVSISDLFDKYAVAEAVVCKIDIEGGESHLLANHTDWLARVVFLTLEVHDRFHQNLIDSSRNIVRVLDEFDLAIVPEKDILHCYSRRALQCERAS
jgi:FkbM family methyltransferase